MLLNHLPISFSSQTFSGFSMPYESSEQLRSLRRRLLDSHYCLRSGDEILLFSYEKNTEDQGILRHFDITENHQIANALARNALLRSFSINKRKISGLKPVKFVNDLRNLLNLGNEYFAIYPEYSFDVRPLAPSDGALINGVVLDFGACLMILPTVAKLVQSKINLEGMYVVIDNDVEENYILPMFNRRLAGRIARIEGDTAVLEDARIDRVSIDSAYIEASLMSIERIGKQLLGVNYVGFMKKFQSQLYEVSGADKQVARIQKLLKDFKDLKGSLPCCDGLSLSLQGHLFEIKDGIGVGLARKLSLPACSLRPGGSITVPWPVDPEIDRNGPFDADTFEPKDIIITVIYPPSYKGNVEQFLAQLRGGVPSTNARQPFKQGFIRKFRLKSATFILVPVTGNGNTAAAYRAAALEAASKNPHVAIIVLREADKELIGPNSPYYVSKATLMSLGIPVQMVRIETILQPNVAYSLNNIALALYAKLGGIPWTLSVQQKLTHEIIVGIGSARVGQGRLGKSERVVGITTMFSGDGNYLLGNTTKEVNTEEYFDALLGSLRADIEMLRKRFGWQAGDRLRIIFHQSFKKYRDIEADAVKQLVAELNQFEVEFSFVHVSWDHAWKLFDPNKPGVISYGKSIKGVAVPDRGWVLPLGPRAALITLTGPNQLKTSLQGCPRPILISIHPESTFHSLDYIAKQVFDLTFMSWRSVMPATQPVSIAYSNMLVNLLAHLRLVPNWNPDVLITKLRESRWFL